VQKYVAEIEKKGTPSLSLHHMQTITGRRHWISLDFGEYVVADGRIRVLESGFRAVRQFLGRRLRRKREWFAETSVYRLLCSQAEIMARERLPVRVSMPAKHTLSGKDEYLELGEGFFRTAERSDGAG